MLILVRECFGGSMAYNHVLLSYLVIRDGSIQYQCLVCRYGLGISPFHCRHHVPMGYKYTDHVSIGRQYCTRRRHRFSCQVGWGAARVRERGESDLCKGWLDYIRTNLSMSRYKKTMLSNYTRVTKTCDCQHWLI